MFSTDVTVNFCVCSSPLWAAEGGLLDRDNNTAEQAVQDLRWPAVDDHVHRHYQSPYVVKQEERKEEETTMCCQWIDNGYLAPLEATDDSQNSRVTCQNCFLCRKERRKSALADTSQLCPKDFFHIYVNHVCVCVCVCVKNFMHNGATT